MINFFSVAVKTLATTVVVSYSLDGFTQVKNQEATVLLYNVAFAGITSGIGSCINKPKQIKWHKAFLTGFWQGSIGGALNYSAKKTLHLVYKNKSIGYALPATLLNAAGYSIMENAALHKPFLENWTLDYGPLRVNFSTKSMADFKVRLLPESIYAVVDLSRSGKFDLGTSLLTGTISFKSKGAIYLQNTGLYYDGYSNGRAFIYTDDGYADKYHIVSHELTHYYQYRDYQIFNTWLKPIGNRVNSPIINKVFSKYIYLDIPYFWPFYNLAGLRSGSSYYRNFYEFEAERFSTNSYVPIQ